MKKNMMPLIRALLLVCLGWPIFLQAQNTTNGLWLPVSGANASTPIRFLVIFYEVDRTLCGGDPCPDRPDLWEPGELPPNVLDANGNDVFAAKWFDQTLAPGQAPTTGNLTDYFWESSMGHYLVLGCSKGVFGLSDYVLILGV